jgi:hypothetical protein
MLAGALIVGQGLVGAGFLIGRGFEHGRSAVVLIVCAVMAG